MYVCMYIYIYALYVSWHPMYHKDSQVREPAGVRHTRGYQPHWVRVPRVPQCRQENMEKKGIRWRFPQRNTGFCIICEVCLDIKCYWCWEFVHDFKSDHWTQELTTYPSNILTTAPHPYEGNRFEQCSFFLCFREGGNLSIILGWACCLDSWSWIPIEVMEIFHSPMFFQLGVLLPMDSMDLHPTLVQGRFSEVRCWFRASTQVEEVGKQRLGALLHVVVPLLPGRFFGENAGDFEEPIFQ